MLVFWLLCIITCLLGMSLSNRAVSDIVVNLHFKSLLVVLNMHAIVRIMHES